MYKLFIENSNQRDYKMHLGELIVYIFQTEIPPQLKRLWTE